MANVWTAQKDADVNVPRSTVDMSHQNNLTMRFGALTPVFCQEVLPGDSFRINPTFGLRFMPLVFPVQTRMRAYMHFYYCRNRAVWKNWQDFIYQTKKDLVQPYIGSSSPVSFKTGELADYLGVPTTLYGDFDSDVSVGSSVYPAYNIQVSSSDVIGNGIGLTFFSSSTALSYSVGEVLNILPQMNTVTESGSSTGRYELDYYNIPSFASMGYRVVLSKILGEGVNLPNEFVVDMGFSKDVLLSAGYPDWSVLPKLVLSAVSAISDIKVNEITRVYDASVEELTLENGHYGIKFKYDGTISRSGLNLNIILLPKFSNWDSSQSAGVSYLKPSMLFGSVTDLSAPNFYFHYYFKGGYDLSSLPAGMNPFLNGKAHLNALPFRHYESIYNCYYRNQQNDPFKINGEVEYNKWVTTDDDGADNTDYHLYYRNWELDQFTSCLPSPQADGVLPPLVGIVDRSGTQTMAFSDEDGNVHSVHAVASDDGSAPSKLEIRDLADADAKEIVPLADIATQGITIEDFRFVNAVQRFLELKIRKGYKYKDLTKGYYDVDIKYDDLNMPEFIGGVSQDVNVNQVTSTSATDSANLGDYAGQATCFGQTGSITKYCDEAGFIIGILSVVPVPVYSQIIPKFFLKQEALDYYFPQFANLSYQPVSKKELAPLQYFNQTSDTDEVFGYNRPWYDYVSALDTVHGDFRTTLRGFLMNRVFDGVPTLGHDFLAVDPGQINDVFVSTDATDDKILGEIWFDVEKKTTVPYTVIPKLE